jgi:hypothetical protein
MRQQSRATGERHANPHRNFQTPKKQKVPPISSGLTGHSRQISFQREDCTVEIFPLLHRKYTAANPRQMERNESVNETRTY